MRWDSSNAFSTYFVTGALTTCPTPFVPRPSSMLSIRCSLPEAEVVTQTRVILFSLLMAPCVSGPWPHGWLFLLLLMPNRLLKAKGAFLPIFNTTSPFFSGPLPWACSCPYHPCTLLSSLRSEFQTRVCPSPTPGEKALFFRTSQLTSAFLISKI